jgi:KUP system potassium uptake protein
LAVRALTNSEGGRSPASGAPPPDGFMERPDIPALLETARAGGCGIDLSDVTYYVGHETVVPSDSDKRLPRWVEALFATMQRNSVHVSEYFKLPRDSVVEIGREVAI